MVKRMDTPNDWEEWAPAIALLREAADLFMDVVFAPDCDKEGNRNGWTISAYVVGFTELYEDPYCPTVQLSSAFDLPTACVAAMKPLAEVRDRVDACLDRDDEKERTRSST